jgi:hypothetical protein
MGRVAQYLSEVCRVIDEADVNDFIDTTAA